MSVALTLAIIAGDNMPLFSVMLKLASVSRVREAMLEPWWQWTVWLACAITIRRIMVAL